MKLPRPVQGNPTHAGDTATPPTRRLLPVVIGVLLLAATATPAAAGARFYVGGFIGLPPLLPPPVAYVYPPPPPPCPPYPAYVPGYAVIPPRPWPPGHWKSRWSYAPRGYWGRPYPH